MPGRIGFPHSHLTPPGFPWGGGARGRRMQELHRTHGKSAMEPGRHEGPETRPKARPTWGRRCQPPARTEELLAQDGGKEGEGEGTARELLALRELVMVALGTPRPRFISGSCTNPGEPCCCLSFPTCKADEMMPWARVFIFSPTNLRFLQKREGSEGVLGLAVPSHAHPHPCCRHPLSCIPPLLAARMLGRSDPFSSPLQAPPPSPLCHHSQVRFFS